MHSENTKSDDDSMLRTAWSLCGRYFRSLENFQKHAMKDHTSVKDDLLDQKCFKCDIKFESFSLLT